MKSRAFGLVVLAVVASAASASQNPGAVFLMIWPAARPTALAGAFTSTADDASSIFYNQGGMAFLDRTHATLMHCNWLPGLYDGMYYEYAGLTHAIKGYGNVGGNIIYLTTGETQVINERGDFLGAYTTFDVAVTAAYGYPVLPNLGVGIGAKFIYSFLVPDWVWRRMPELGIEAGGTGITWAFDAGALYKPFRFLNLGAAVANIGPNISYTDTGEDDPLPRMLRLAFTYYPVQNDVIKVGISPEFDKILVGMFYNPDGTKTFSRMFQEEMRDAWKSLGVEASFINLLYARVGYFEDLTGQRGGIVLKKDDQSHHYGLGDVLTRKDLGKFESIGLCFGGGIEFARFKFDLSVDQLIYDFPTSNYKFSFSYQF
jgi:hypothetical protein